MLSTYFIVGFQFITLTKIRVEEVFALNRIINVILNRKDNCNPIEFIGVFVPINIDLNHIKGDNRHIGMTEVNVLQPIEQYSNLFAINCIFEKIFSDSKV